MSVLARDLHHPLTIKGHVAAACTGLRILYDDSVPVLPSEEAFTKLQEVDNDGGAAAFRDVGPA